MTSPSKILIYGAYGYTAKLIIELAKERHIPLTLAGRDEQQLMKLQDTYGYPYRCFSLENKDSISENIKDMNVVLHCAGPFSETAKPMVKACIKNKVHYADITGEVWVFDDIAAKDTEAKKAGVVLLPGVGFDVVPTDCLAAFLFDKMPDAATLELAFAGAQKPSRGTSITMLKNIHKGGFIRRNGQLKSIKVASLTKEIPFGDKIRTCMSIAWGDLATAYYQTNIPNITVYIGVGKKTIGKMKKINLIRPLLKIKWINNRIRSYIKKKVDGPDKSFREQNKTQIWGRIQNAKGDVITAHYHTPEAYQLTAMTALEAAVRLADGEVYPGYKTPAQAFGMNFIQQIEGVSPFKLQQN